MEITTEESSQGVGDRNNSSSTSADDKEDDENMPSLSSEQLARRPSFKSVTVMHVHLLVTCVHIYCMCCAVNHVNIYMC